MDEKKTYGVTALNGDLEAGPFKLALSPFNSDAATELVKMQVRSSIQLKEVLRRLHGCVKDQLSNWSSL